VRVCKGILFLKFTCNFRRGWGPFFDHDEAKNGNISNRELHSRCPLAEGTYDRVKNVKWNFRWPLMRALLPPEKCLLVVAVIDAFTA
jgi:hypothetical protein